MVAPLIDLIGHNLRACIRVQTTNLFCVHSCLFLCYFASFVLLVAYCVASPIDGYVSVGLLSCYSQSRLISYLLIRSLVAHVAHMHFWLAASNRKATECRELHSATPFSLLSPQLISRKLRI